MGVWRTSSVLHIISKFKAIVAADLNLSGFYQYLPVHIICVIIIMFIDIPIVFLVFFKHNNLKMFEGKILSLDRFVISDVQIPVIIQQDIFNLWYSYPLSSGTISSLALFHEKRDSPESSKLEVWLGELHWAVARWMRPIGHGEVVAQWYILAALELLVLKVRVWW